MGDRVRGCEFMIEIVGIVGIILVGVILYIKREEAKKFGENIVRRLLHLFLLVVLQLEGLWEYRVLN